MLWLNLTEQQAVVLLSETLLFKFCYSVLSFGYC